MIRKRLRTIFASEIFCLHKIYTIKPYNIMRKVILLTAMPKESVWSSSIYVNGGGKLLSSKISFSRILLLFVCCIFCNNVFAQDWQTIQDFESSPALTACSSADIKSESVEASVAPNDNVTASIQEFEDGHGKAGKLSKTIDDNNTSYGIVFSVSLGSNTLSNYTNIKLDTYNNNDYKYVCVYVRQSGTNDKFKKLLVKSNGFGLQGQWSTVELTQDEQQQFATRTSDMNYSNVEFYIGYREAYGKIDVYIDNIQLFGPAIGSSAIEIDETKNNTITAKNNATVNLTRSLVKDVWNTICLPFVPTEDQAKTIFGTTAKFAQFSSVSNGVMQFTSVDVKDLHAGTPYLVLPSQDKTTVSPIELTDVTIPDEAKNAGKVTHNDDTGVYTFQGIYSPTPFEQATWPWIRFVAKDNQLKYPNTNNPLKALRAYFTVPVPGGSGASTGAKDYTFAVDSFVPTSIANIQIEGDGDGAIYNIGGQRVEGKSLPKGIYIREGKKFVVK